MKDKITVTETTCASASERFGYLACHPAVNGIVGEQHSSTVLCHFVWSKFPCARREANDTQKSVYLVAWIQQYSYKICTTTYIVLLSTKCPKRDRVSSLHLKQSCHNCIIVITGHTLCVLGTTGDLELRIPTESLIEQNNASSNVDWKRLYSSSDLTKKFNLYSYIAMKEFPGNQLRKAIICHSSVDSTTSHCQEQWYRVCCTAVYFSQSVSASMIFKEVAKWNSCSVSGRLKLHGWMVHTVGTRVLAGQLKLVTSDWIS